MGALRKVFTFFGWIVAIGIGLSMLSFVFLIVGLLTGNLSDPSLKPIVTKTENAIGVVELTGEILTSNKFSERLSKLVESENIKGIVVRIDSPGGSVGASEEMNRLIREADAKKPVICSLANIAASGGLYAAVGCRKIVANEGTLTGSIGVLLTIPNFANISDKVGFKMNTIKSGPFKDTGSPFREFKPEEQDLMQRLVDKSYQQFVRIVASGRKLDEGAVRRFADGRIILGEQAVELGLIDEIGGLTRAAKLALEAAGNSSGQPEIIPPDKGSAIFGMWDDVSESRVWNWFRAYGQVQLLYRAYL